MMVGAVGIGCAGVVVAGIAATAATARRWEGRGPGARRARGWLLAGPLVLAAAATMTALIAARGGWLVAAAAYLTGTTVVAGAMVVELTRLPGLPAEPGARVRRILDGLLAGGSVFLVGWQWLFAPTPGRLELGGFDRGGFDLGGFDLGGFEPGGFVGVVAAAAAVACLSGGVATVAAWRSRRPGVGASPRVVAVAAALVLIAASGPVVTAAFAARSRPTLILLAFVPAVAGCFLLVWSGRLPAPEYPLLWGDAMARLPAEPRPQPPLGAGPTIFCVGVVVVQTAIFTAVAGGLDPGSVAVGIPIAIMLGARVALALRDVRRYAERLGCSEAHFRWMANTDPLTGLANRRRLRQALEAADPDRTTLLALDLDGFKDINDRCGHDVGDAVLIEVGRRLQAAVEPGDLVVRLGGDEFAVLVSAGPEQAYALAERLLTELGRPYEIDGGLQHVSTSIGFAGCASGDDAEATLRNADLALRYAKKRGKSRVERFERAYDRWLQRRIAIERDLRRALVEEELSLVYQPVVAMATGRVVGAEALIRWRHPTLGPLSPAEFVPVVDEMGLAGPLGEWVRDRACRQLARWLAAGHEVWVSVNVSVRELRAPDYAPRMLETLRAHDIPPAHLVLELTEHDVAHDVDELSYTLIALRELGVRIALDDVGAGHSSLGRLRRLAIDVLKIDRSLLAEPSRQAGTPAAPLVDVIVRLGEQLGLDVIAEGVEDPSRLQVVDRAGCPYGQGYLFGRPVPPDRLAAMLVPAIPTQSGGRRNAPPGPARLSGVPGYSGTRR